MPFQIIRNDITLVRADAIVNTANPHPVIGSGTDSAVHRKAGPELLAARREIGDIQPGHAVATPAFGLDAKYVFHTVSPAWRGGDHNELQLLRQAYDAALQLAAEKNCESIAFPLMAAGSYGFPKDKALSVALQAFTDFLLTSDLMVYLVLFSGKAFSLAENLFSDLRSYIDENYVAEKTAQEYPHGKNERRTYSRRQEDGYYREELCSLDAVSYPICQNGVSPAPTVGSAVSGSENLSDLLEDADETFTEALLRLLKKRGGKDSAVYRSCNMSRQLFNKIVNDAAYQPKKSTAIQLAIGLKLSLAETQELLGKAGYVLSRSSKSDLVVQYYIQRGEYSMITIDTALCDAGLPTLCKY